MQSFEQIKEIYLWINSIVKPYDFKILFVIHYHC